MRKWEMQLFGDSRLNLYGWVGTIILVVVASLALVVWAINLGAIKSPIGVLLIAIYLVLVGTFGVVAQNYCARVVHKLKAEENQDD